MVTIVPSRFAGLRIEDDDEDFVKPKQKPKIASTPKSSQPPATGNQKPVNPTQNQKKVKPAKKPKKPVNKEVQREQWSKWQEKDSEIVDTHYEKDLEEALLQSKLDFEANKTKYLKAERELKLESKPKKTRPLSLQQFQCKVEKDTSEKEIQKQKKEDENLYNKKFTFFEQIDRETKQIIQKEQFKTLIANREYSSDNVTQDDSSKEEQPSDAVSEIDYLKADNEALRAEVATLRFKYKKICSILKASEMKDKTDLLIEIEKLKRTQEDMSAEMSALYVQLEQEKSKPSGASYDKGKEKSAGRKSVRFDASSEIHNGKTE